MKIKIILICFLFFALCSLRAQVPHLLSESDVVISNGEITEYLSYHRSIIIPPYLDGQVVTSIGSRAFRNSGLTSVSIPNTVKTIKSSAFIDNQLTSVKIPISVTSIGAQAFRENLLANVSIPNEVTFIGLFAFLENRLNNVTIPNSVVIIGGRAFDNNFLSSFLLPSPNLAGTWSKGSAGDAISADDNSAYYYLASDYTAQDKDFLFENGEIIDYLGAGGNIHIPALINGETVSTIGSQAFAFRSLTAVSIPETVTSIGDRAFYINDLTTVNIPNSVTSLEDEVFRENSLTNVTIPESVNSIGNSAFQSNSLTSITIPDAVTSIGIRAFSYNNLTSVTLPSNISSIEREAFRDNSLTSVIIPEAVTSIGQEAFRDNNLTSVTIPQSVTTIGLGAFNFNSLTSFVLPSPSIPGNWTDGTAGTTVTDLAIEYIYLASNYTPQDEDFLFENGEIKSYTGLGGSVVIPSSINGEQVTSVGISAFSSKNLTSVTIPNTITTIGVSAFQDNTLSSLTLPTTLTSIEPFAFAGNDLSSVNLPSNVIYIGSSAFDINDLSSFELPSPGIVGNWNSGAAGGTVTDLQTDYIYLASNYTAQDEDFLFENGEIKDYFGLSGNVIIPSTINGQEVTSIGNQAFNNVDLEGVTIPNGVTSIGDSAFSNNNLLTVVMPSNLTFIGDYAFQNNSLTGATIPNTVTTIGNYAFKSNSLTSVTLPSTLINIGNETFADNSLTSITIPNSVTSIGFNAFRNSSLTTATIPNSVTDIGAFAFADNNLNSITISDAATSIGRGAFLNNNLTSVTVPNTVTYIGDFAFQNNSLIGLTLSNALTYIGDFSFSDNNLTGISIPNSVNYIGRNAFAGNSIVNFVLPSANIDGYVFDGWLASNGTAYTDSQTVTDLVSSYTVVISENNLVLVSILIEDENVDLSVSGDESIEFNEVGSANFLTAKGNSLVLAPSNVTLPVGYEFEPYSVENIQEALAVVFSDQPIIYELTYEADGGSHNNPTTYTVEDDEIVLSDAVREGYTFGGWYEESSFENDIERIEAGSTGDKTLYAKLTPTIYNLAYEVDGGTHSNPATYTVEDNEVVLSSAVREGYTFEGWFEEASFENAIERIEAGSMGDMTLYAKFTITIKDITVTAVGQTKIYGDADPTFTYTVTSGSLEEGDFFTGSLEREAGEDVGNYSILQGTLTVGANYNLNFISEDLTITQANLSATATDKTKIYGEENPTLSIDYAGFKRSDDATVLDSPPEVSTTATSTSDAGDYPIVLSASTDNNYLISTTQGTLSILKADQTVSINSIPDQDILASPITITATASSGLDVELSVTGPATLDGNILTLDGAEGTVVIIAVQSGNINYKEAKSVNESFEVINTDPCRDFAVTLVERVNSLCFGEASGSVNVEVSGGSGEYSFSWSNGGTTEDLSGLAAGTYSLTVIDDNNCSESLEVIIDEPEMLAISSVVTNETEGNDGAIDLTVTGGSGDYIFSWDNGASTEDLNGVTGGDYSIIVTDANNCTATALITVGGTVTGITAAHIKSKISFYPNPTTDRIIIKSDFHENISLRILSIQGKLIHSNFEIGFGENKFDISGFRKGLYIMEYSKEGIQYADRLIIK